MGQSISSRFKAPHGSAVRSADFAFDGRPIVKAGRTPTDSGRSVHYFVPKHYLDNPPDYGDGVLISLCKRMFLPTTHLFRPVDPKYSICKTCDRTYHELLRERGGDQQA